MDEVRYMTTWEQRFFTHLFTGFAGAALLLACLGVYGLVAYRGSRRAHEIGIRVALGADNSDVLRLLLGQGVGLAAAGIAAGLVLAVAVSRVLGSVVYGSSSSGHAGLYVVTALVLVVPILVASYVPARRAAKVGAMASLRQD